MDRLGELFASTSGDLQVTEVLGGGSLVVTVAFTQPFSFIDDSAEELLSASDVELLADTLDEWLRARGRRR